MRGLGDEMATEFDVKKAEELERKYDSGLVTRALSPWLFQLTFAFSVFFAGYHYITAGIGVPVDYWHMGWHMSGVILLIFIGYPAFRYGDVMEIQPKAWWRIGNVPLWEMISASAARSVTQELIQPLDVSTSTSTRYHRPTDRPWRITLSSMGHAL